MDSNSGWGAGARAARAPRASRGRVTDSYATREVRSRPRRRRTAVHAPRVRWRTDGLRPLRAVGASRGGSACGGTGGATTAYWVLSIHTTHPPAGARGGTSGRVDDRRETCTVRELPVYCTYHYSYQSRSDVELILPWPFPRRSARADALCRRPRPPSALQQLAVST